MMLYVILLDVLHKMLAWLNWNKVEALPCRMNDRIESPTGQCIQTKQSIVYLGTLLCSDGKNNGKK